MDKSAKTPNPRRSACIRCTTAKSKCVLLQDQAVCERCHRLKRSCSFDDSALPRKKKPPSSTRVEQLEAKVEALAAALHSQNQSPLATTGTDSVDHHTPASSYSVGRDTMETSGFLPTHVPRSEPFSSSETPTPLTDEPRFSIDPVERGLLSPMEAEVLLEKFRVQKTPYFPFVIIPHDATAEALRRRSPFLFLSIMTVCLEDRLRLQRLLLVDVKRTVSRRIVEAEEKNLELLQGLLISICWYHYHIPGSKQLFMYLQLASSLVLDLGLDRPTSAPSIIDNIRKGTDRSDMTSRGRSSAEYRAFLGFYFLYPPAAIFRRQIVLKHTPWVLQCCTILEANNEYPTDRKLKTYFQTQALSLKVDEVCNREEETHRGSDKMLDVMIKMFHKELSDIKRNLPKFNAAENACFSLQLKALSMSIYELSLRRFQAEATTKSNLELSQLWALMEATRDLVQYFVQLPDNIVQHLPINCWTTVWYAYLLLTKVASLPSGPSWDSAVVRTEVNLEGLVEGARSQLRSVSRGLEEHNSDEVEDIWLFFLRGAETVLEMEKIRQCETASQSSDEEMSDTNTTKDDTQPQVQPRVVPEAPKTATSAMSGTQDHHMAYYNQTTLPNAMNIPGTSAMPAPVPIRAPAPPNMNPMFYGTPSNVWDDSAWQRALNDIPFDNSMYSFDNSYGLQFF